MTREEILAMPAGRELDLLIRTKVFGHQLEGFEWASNTSHSLTKVVGSVIVPHNVPEYSTDLAAAWEVEKEILAKQKWERYVSEIELMVKNHPELEKRKFYMIHANPEQRCKAALLTTMEETP